MNWRLASHYHIASAGGRYTVSRSWCAVRRVWTYQAWHVRHNAHGDKLGMPNQLAVGDKQVCIAACDIHAAQSQQCPA